MDMNEGLLGLIIVCVILVVAGGYFIYQYRKEDK